MHYHLYCYKSQLGRPDLGEAKGVVGMKEGGELIQDTETKKKIVQELIKFNPNLVSFGIEYEEIAKLKGTTIAEAKEDFDHIELSTPDGELSTQITVFDNNVSIAVPYWYTGSDAAEVFSKVGQYTKIIRHTANYFVYDPQTGNVYDPMLTDFDGLMVYLRISGESNGIKPVLVADSKPWWKFWQ